MLTFVPCKGPTERFLRSLCQYTESTNSLKTNVYAYDLCCASVPDYETWYTGTQYHSYVKTTFTSL